MSSRRVALFGGSFDPPHFGHLHVARAARAELSLDEVRLLPAAEPPHKRTRVLAPASDRLEMVTRLAQLEPWLVVDRRELARGGTSYTFDTLTEVRAELAGEVVELYFLIGSDSLFDLPNWHRAAELVRLARFVTVARDRTRLDLAAAELHARLPAAAPTLLTDLLRVAPLPISSSQVRERCRLGASIDDLVPPRVREWIEQRGLYRG